MLQRYSKKEYVFQNRAMQKVKNESLSEPITVNRNFGEHILPAENNLIASWVP